ncbi:hypothetical protein [Methylobacterium sp. Gmos1]
MGEILRHKKTGGLYEVLFRGVRLRAHRSLADYDLVLIVRHGEASEITACSSMFNAPAGASILFAAIVQSSAPLVHGAEVVGYRALNGGPAWARPTSEMEDGRFEPVSPTPSPEGEVEGLVEKLIYHARLSGSAESAVERYKGSLSEATFASGLRVAEERLQSARTALLSRLSTSPVDTTGRDPSGPDCRPSDQAPSGLAAYGASIPRAGEVPGLIEDLINFARLYERLIDRPSEIDEATQVALEIEETKASILSAIMARAALKDTGKMTRRPGFSTEEERQVAASERIFAAVHTYLTEMEETEEGGEDIEIRQFEAMKTALAVADRARDQRASREDGDSRPRPEAASPVDEVEAPSPTPSLQTQGAINPPDCREEGSRDEQSERFIAESIALEEEETLAQILFEQDPGAPLLKWDQLWSEIKDKYRQDARIKLSASPRPSKKEQGDA